MNTKMLIDEKKPKSAIILTKSDIDCMHDETAFNTFLKSIGIKDRLTFCSKPHDTETELSDYTLHLKHYLIRNEEYKQYILIVVCEDGAKYNTIKESIQYFFNSVKNFHIGVFSFKNIVYDRIPHNLPNSFGNILSTPKFNLEVGDVFTFEDGSVYINGGYTEGEMHNQSSGFNGVMFNHNKLVVSIHNILDKK